MNREFESFVLDPQVVRALQQSKENRRKGNLHAAVKMSADILLLSGASALIIFSDHVIYRVAGAMLFGLLQISWLESMHWSVHNTLFTSKKVNKWCGHFSGFMCLRPFLYFRANHLGHHRFLGDANKDPERIEGDKSVEKSMGGRISWLLLTTTRRSMDGAIRILKVAFAASEKHRLAVMPFVSRPVYRKLVTECRILIVGYSCLAIGFSLLSSPAVLLYWPIALWMHILCVLFFATPEHAALYDESAADRISRGDGDENIAAEESSSKYVRYVSAQMAMTRMFTTNFIVRYLRWNENYHSIHHAYPNARYTELPAIARAIGKEFPNRYTSYAGFHLFGDK